MDNAVVRTIVTAELVVMISITRLGCNIQSSLVVTKVYSPDLGEVCRIHTLKSFRVSGITHDLIRINISRYCPLIELINKVVIILNSHICIIIINIGVVSQGCIFNEVHTSIRSNGWTNFRLLFSQIRTITHPLIQVLIIKQRINNFQDSSKFICLFGN